ncbi:ATP-dependent DNA helicase PcrA [Mycolicibacterium hassiacum DSM 44199]|jgi:DNA helicase-2/ATP-dependent DNA helicase PcrA|uniref:ATP-dependent DNA helicase n=1 Tax=Mycolicibacterium hassiacum (strain DSM 44199 / CIP 105218 / JCM 12690 / 3849) TaxID=1122247 RepID=K5BDX2_MYCHD|nr:DNA helicase PcrA [Mycolicibacterium hassiacum]EKF22527.1 ATP-dependent DNA helicase PcrA [Mycolicibacterium hassiacum DSM 44199]MBX5485021.1 DNA helicase PcrA [Mycolicibacterium hassiacum]MDA4084836.1 ATP-dependent DNA helicase PcrA [Mycolicibacterium hassiacum DSM 44199]PZN21360.1 MAG: DNA helicase PcrA [Mycolicibacterium hassiacum]VCT91666.1 ATP-dependent DNA helicase UvrD1 [Mycolicibacterium hassiacum DSM 44199]
MSTVTESDQLLDGLNPQQRQAVLHEGSPLLIVAGAGSGKTAVLTRRIAYLLAARDVGVGQVLAITFTNKAAAEMRERVVALVGPHARSMWVSTFHSTCVRILRNQASLIKGLNSNFSIYDADDSRRLLMMIGKDMGLDTKRYSPRLLATGISNHKNELIGPEQAAAEAAEAGEELPRIIAEVYAEYQRRLRAANALDFDDLIGETVALLQAFPQIAQYYRRRFRHILVDEYQDTNHAQYVLVRELVGPDAPADDPAAVPPAELCVVGDADQSIYAFRGATIRNIEDFERDFPNATTILLEQNYRSTQNILNAANAVIARNTGRREKRLWTDAGDGEPIVGYVADNEHDEARFVAEEIDALVERGVSYSDIAVFYRTNNSSRALEEVFIRAGIPYKVVGGVRFYERKEIRDIVAYLRVLDNPGDSVSMRRILNTPRRGIGERAEACVAVYAENTGCSFNDALQAAAEGKVPMLNTRAEKCIAAFMEMLDELRGRLDDGLGDLVEAVLDRTGYRAELESSSDPQDLARLDNLNELVSVAHEFSIDLANAQDSGDIDPADEDIPDTSVLAQFLERVSLVADADELPEEGAGVVTLMTLHTAKGLEFPVVFLTGWEDGMFPHMRALGDPTELAEERRLAYVGITRARERLYVSRAKVRSSWGQPMLNPESRFLQEIPQHLIEWRRTDPTPSSLSAPVSGVVNRFSTPRPSPIRSAAGKRPLIVLQPGDRVSHDKYGLGRVEEVTGTGESAMSLIDFGSAGRVKLMHNHAPITKL